MTNPRSVPILPGEIKLLPSWPALLPSAAPEDLSIVAVASEKVAPPPPKGHSIDEKKLVRIALIVLGVATIGGIIWLAREKTKQEDPKEKD